jgi:hypothetical protein
LIDHSALNRETGAGIPVRLPESVPVRVPTRKILRLAARVRPRTPHTPRAGDLQDRLLDSATLLLGDFPDRRVSLLLLLNMRMSGYFRRNQRAGSAQAR